MASLSEILVNLLKDVRNFKVEVDDLSGDEIMLNYRINRNWKSLQERLSNFRAGLSALSPSERKDFANNYKDMRDELFSLMDELSDSVNEKSHMRKNIEDTAKLGGVLSVFVGVVGIAYKLYTGKDLPGK
jgi:predicted  nucleic acid-binding Zn-ribbon protein